MRLLLPALTSLAVAVGVPAPLTKLTPSNVSPSSTSKTAKLGPLRRDHLPLDRLHGVSTNQNRYYWKFDFALNLDSGSRIRQIEFEGGGLYGSVGWGSDWWEYKWFSISVEQDGKAHFILDQEHWDGLAYQSTQVSYVVTHEMGTHYSIAFYFRTVSFWSFTGSWGNWVIGNAFNLISY